MALWRLAAALGLLLPIVAQAQTAGGGPTAPGLPGVIGKRRPVPPRMPGPAVVKPGGIGRAPADPLKQPLPKPTAAERAEQRKLERDLRICIGC